MLDIAIKYKDQLNSKIKDIYFNDKYKYWFADNYCYVNDINDDTWNKNDFVSVNSSGEVLGFFSYKICRQANYAHNFKAINLSNKDSNLIFSMDFRKCLRDIFEKFNFNKLNFMVVVGNPIEKAYDKMIKKHGGRIVGYYKDDCVLWDNKYYDIKIYEIMRSDYLKSKGKS